MQQLIFASALITAGCAQATPSKSAATHVSVQAPASDHSRQGVAVTPTPTPVAEADLAPARIIVPRLHLNALVLPVGADVNGAMLAPRQGQADDPVWSEVYWGDVGALPGQVGNAVVAGHVNRPDGSASTFTHLDALVPGDAIDVVTANAGTLHFRVTAKESATVYVHGGNDPTIERIFGPASTPNLNLMTCWGQWDGTQYNQRLVIYSTLVGQTPATPMR